MKDPSGSIPSQGAGGPNVTGYPAGEAMSVDVAVLDAVSARVVLLDPDGRITWMNRACESCLGRAANAVTGRPFADVFALAASPGATAAALASAAAGRVHPELELSWFPAEGEEQWLTWTFIPLRPAEGRPSLVATGVDTTSRRRMARELRVTEDSVRQVGRLEPFARSVGRVAHDFNNALTALLGYTDVLEASLRGAAEKRNAADVREAAERVAELTVQLRGLVAEVLPDSSPLGTASARSGDSAAGAKVVLLAEDEPIVRRIMVETLRREGWSVLEAASGADALRRAQDSGAPVDLLVTNIVMPGMDGRELADRLRRDQPGLPVLYVTGFSSEADPRRLPSTNAALLQKPFLPEVLLETARALLAARSR